jgi:Flp pilus assembly protein TadG
MVELNRFRGDERGNFAMTAAIAMVPILGLAGAALDYSRVASVKTQLQSAADSAVLAAIAEYRSGGSDDMEEIAERYFKANYDGGFRPSIGIRLSGDKSVVTLAAHADVPTTFLQVVGQKKLRANAETEAGVGVAMLQIALVLDVTGSMNRNSKLTVLKDTAQEFIDNILPIGQNNDNLVEFSVVPFNTVVKVDTAWSDRWWLDLNGHSRAGWHGCVWDRSAAWDNGTAEPRSGNVDSFYQASPSSLAETGNCAGMVEVMPLSGDRNRIAGRIQSLSASGMTNTNVGMVWGINTLDANLPYQQARADARKIIVFLTDGNNTDGRIRRKGGTIAQMDPETLTTCTEAKADGIEIFTIRVMEGNETMLQACASAPSNYYNVTASQQLGAVFESISEKIWTSAVALRK